MRALPLLSLMLLLALPVAAQDLSKTAVARQARDAGASPAEAASLARAVVPQQTAVLAASDAQEGDRFAWSVALSGDRALVGAYSAGCADGTLCGAAYVFARSGASWTQEAILTASDAQAGDIFGYSVSLSGDRAIVGASSADCADGDNCGAAYVFARSGTSWTQEAILTASDAQAGDFFGGDVSISGDRALVGAQAAAAETGAAYVFANSGGTWAEETILTASDAQFIDEFGFSVSLSGDRALVGARSVDCADGVDCGAAYVFDGLIPPVAASGNDHIETAAPVWGGPVDYTGSTVGVPADDADTAATCTFGGPTNDLGNAVWWSFRAATDGLVRVDTEGSDFDTVLSVLDAETGVELSCNDDESSGNTASVFDIGVTAGTLYLVRVSGFQGAEGAVALEVSGAPITGPPGDDSSTVLGLLSGVPATDTNRGATLQAGEDPLSCGVDGGNSVWRAFVAPGQGEATVDLVGSTFDTVLGVYDDEFTELACNDDFTSLTSRIEDLPVRGGVPYYVRISGYDGDEGDLVIAYDFDAAGFTSIVIDGRLGFRYLGAPADGVTLDDLADMNLVRGVPGYYPNARAPNIWTSYSAATGSWVPAAGTGEVLQLGHGFRWQMYDKDQGNPNVSLGYEFPVTIFTAQPANTADVDVTLDTDGGRFNFIANPFAETLDLTDIYNWPGGTQHLSPNAPLWVYNAETRSWDEDPVSVEPWEAFRAKAKGPRVSGDRVLTIPASATTTLARTAARSAEMPRLGFSLAGTGADGIPVADRALSIRFVDDARPGFDADEDVEKFQVPDPAYALIGARTDGQYLGHDVRPFVDAEIPLAVEARGTARTFTLSWDAETLPAGRPIVLVDLVTGDEIDVRAESEVVFEVAPLAAHDEVPLNDLANGAEATDRFVLRIGTPGLSAEADASEVALTSIAPNPSSGGARVSFAVPEAGAVRLTVLDVRGRRVATLVDGPLSAGRHEARLDGSLAAGVYIIRLEAGGTVITRQAVVVR